jgi:hypothetical protein
MRVMPRCREERNHRSSGRFPARDKVWRSKMKTIFMISAAILAFSAAAQATPVDEMVKQGFACDPGVRGEVVCRKDGAASKICNAQGSCFRIVHENGALNKDSISTGSIQGGIRPAHSADPSEY